MKSQFYLAQVLFPIFLLATFCFGQDFTLNSPNDKLVVHINTKPNISFSVNLAEKTLVAANSISMTMDNRVLGKTPKVKKTETRTVDQSIQPEIREKNKTVRDNYNELLIQFDQAYSLIFRAYDNGVAYRFSTEIKNDVVVFSENAHYQFSDSDSVFVCKETEFGSSYEKPYSRHSISEIEDDALITLPVLVDKKSGIKILIMESDLEDYPGMWLKPGQSASFNTVFPAYPLNEDNSGNAYSKGRVGKKAQYIARTAGTRDFPWRILAIAENDADLLTNQLVYQLAQPCQIEDPSWIKPGWVILDWWARRNIFGVDFKAGFNTETSKYFIDFCADYGIKYFLLDDGWSNRENLLDVNPAINMEQVTAYAKEKGVGVVLWCIWATLDRQYEEALDQFYKWGIEGIKIDFMNRDDQKMVNYYHKMAKETAKRKMIIDFHGAYKPAGLRRMYPNVLTREGFIEFEYNGWKDNANPNHHTLLPFIRGVAGPMDYIPGTFNNATKKNYRPVGDKPMGQGTRAHSIALAIIMESPMQMIPDSPSDYMREEECSRFLMGIPVEWDETKVLDAKIGDYIILARRNNDVWYVSAITDWQPRKFEIDFSFLEKGQYKINYIKDGKNADTRAIDYKMGEETVSRNETRKINLAPGGGWIARIFK